MLLLNFSHPLTPSQKSALEALLGEVEVQAVPCHFDQSRPFAEQALSLADTAGLTPDEWQGRRLAVVPPSLSGITAVLLAEIHGRAGYFVPVVRMRPVAGSVPPTFEVAEVIDLQGLRDAARKRRAE